jgi:hypothetical protein
MVTSFHSIKWEMTSSRAVKDTAAGFNHGLQDPVQERVFVFSWNADEGQDLVVSHVADATAGQDWIPKFYPKLFTAKIPGGIGLIVLTQDGDPRLNLLPNRLVECFRGCVSVCQNAGQDAIRAAAIRVTHCCFPSYL